VDTEEKKTIKYFEAEASEGGKVTSLEQFVYSQQYTLMDMESRADKDGIPSLFLKDL
jgi:hypothetical protein